jgi:hypothetical protein
VLLVYGTYANFQGCKEHFCQAAVTKTVNQSLRPRVFKVKEIRVVHQILKRSIERHSLPFTLEEAMAKFPITSEEGLF